MDIKQQIFKELSALEESAEKLRASAVNAGRQTDLELAILTEQVRVLRDKNSHAAELVDKSINILKNFT
ncbi:MAG: hypothetical protein LBD50_02325 [Rickettsiales bacterium]|jgi:hypothetical protein|nr:hypothetical protein [Rickettsiales bacterium]